MSTSNRRDFIKQSMIGTAGLTIGGMGFSAKSYAAISGANDRINVAVIGIRNQGTVHLNSWCGLKDSHNVQIRALCDTDEQLFAPALKLVEQKSGAKPTTHWDLRAVLDQKEIDAVSIVTPNHWHALATVWACQAGKHVYVEKPASHNIWEGRKMIEAARKYQRRMQVGLNNRSARNVRDAIAFLHSGSIGELYMARALCFKARDSYGLAKDGTPPAAFHYDQWLGPAPQRPYNEKRSHYNWHWYWDTGNGDTGNTGPHQLDLARWGMAKNDHPVSVYSAGGIYGFRQDDSVKTPGTKVYGGVETYGHDKTAQETPNTQTAVYTYGDGKLIELETRGRYTNHEGSKGQEVGNLFYGTDGWLEISGNTWKAFHKRGKEPIAGSKDGETERVGNHWANFIDALRSGKDETLHADIVEGHLSTSLCHLANISYRVGRSLKFSGKDEKFLKDAEADAHLTRVYRKPYVVPEKV
ncbi:Gfo/Idh/MocA family protein [Horticoccus sp. 23ND18S-11]|uniref:Gfo/Idh/MocA family protein n=1 Tax=Horticoccus sp. 23ND18S-11 TaxID=3391832 RepID=UPI0039C95EB0